MGSDAAPRARPGWRRRIPRHGLMRSFAAGEGAWAQQFGCSILAMQVCTVSKLEMSILSPYLPGTSVLHYEMSEATPSACVTVLMYVLLQTPKSLLRCVENVIVLADRKSQPVFHLR